MDDFFAKGDTVIAENFASSATTFTYAQTGVDSCWWTLTDGAACRGRVGPSKRRSNTGASERLI